MTSKQRYEIKYEDWLGPTELLHKTHQNLSLQCAFLYAERIFFLNCLLHCFVSIVAVLHVTCFTFLRLLLFQI